MVDLKNNSKTPPLPATPEQNPNPPPKSNKSCLITILIICIIGILLLVCVTFGWLYFHSYQDKQKLTQELSKITSSSSTMNPSVDATPSPQASASGNIDERDVKIAQLEAEINTLKAQLKRYNLGLNNALKYSNAFQFLTNTVSKYGGLNGWQNSDYQQGLQIAKDTGDQKFVDATENAWNNQNQPQDQRLYLVLSLIQSGIHDAIKTALSP